MVPWGSVRSVRDTDTYLNLFTVYLLGLKNRFSFSECNTERVKSEPINEAKTFSWMDLHLCRTLDSSKTGFFFWQLPLEVATCNPISKKVKLIIDKLVHRVHFALCLST